MLDIPIVYETCDETEISPEADFSMRGSLNKMESTDAKVSKIAKIALLCFWILYFQLFLPRTVNRW